ncbi:hypothetical protein Harman_11670 [Haloarcula mannanilytica]|uniref:DUF4935 domain-containing protein n=1 Tax=Haloarcula mannanilytica TaxID=2509225 RepID=A0A4C2EFU9_9EURY|nr:hypothetical protein [Haloarcula mannanilytica]GCF13232.1 hypothetical protein Harman_11670 [Haloarcula mannanilytica]
MVSVFLDNGLVIAYCFTIHEFHPECDEYIEDSDSDLYITQEIDTIFNKKKSDISRELSTDILEHQADIKRGNFPDQLGPTDLKDCQKMIHSKNDARRFLLNWYSEEVGSFVRKHELTERLRDLANDIESRAEKRKSDFDDYVGIWARSEDYPDVQDALKQIKESKEEDMWVCIDAHDLAVNTDGETVLATTDANDFINNGRRDLILDSTAIDEIEPVGKLSVK